MCNSKNIRLVHLVIARITLIANFATLIATIVLLATFRWDATGHQLINSVDAWLLGWLIVGLVFSCVGIVVAVADINGIHKNRYRYMLPFFFYLVANSVAFGNFFVAFPVLIILLSTSDKPQETSIQKVMRTHLCQLIAADVVSFIVTVLSVISCVVVRLHIRNGKLRPTMPKNILDERMKNRRFSWEMYSPITKRPNPVEVVRVHNMK